MTIEEAAATLGLTPSKVSPELVDRNYRMKVKHCHPDRARYPGADVEFKRATEAFDRLKQPTDWPTEDTVSDASIELKVAVDTFFFAAICFWPEHWLALDWSERLGVLIGNYELHFNTKGQLEKGAPLIELVDRRGDRPSRPLLVAPVAVEVVKFEGECLRRMWVLRPLETSQLPRHLERIATETGGLESATERLRTELLEASRAPLMYPSSK